MRSRSIAPELASDFYSLNGENCVSNLIEIHISHIVGNFDLYQVSYVNRAQGVNEPKKRVRATNISSSTEEEAKLFIETCIFSALIFRPAF